VAARDGDRRRGPGGGGLGMRTTITATSPRGPSAARRPICRHRSPQMADARAWTLLRRKAKPPRTARRCRRGLGGRGTARDGLQRSVLLAGVGWPRPWKKRRLSGAPEIHRSRVSLTVWRMSARTKRLRQLGIREPCAERLGDPRRIPALSSQLCEGGDGPGGTSPMPSTCCAARVPWSMRAALCPGHRDARENLRGDARRPPPRDASD